LNRAMGAAAIPFKGYSDTPKMMVSHPISTGLPVSPRSVLPSSVLSGADYMSAARPRSPLYAQYAQPDFAAETALRLIPPLPIEKASIDLDALFSLPDRAAFKQLSVPTIDPGGLGGRTLKFLITGFNKSKPKLHLINSHKYDYHYSYIVEALNITLSNATFNWVTYLSKTRTFLAGSIVEHKSFGETGLYGISFWPMDVLSLEHLKLTYKLIRTAFPKDMKVAFHAVGVPQQDLVDTHKKQLAADNIAVISNEELFAGINYSPLNLGKSVGRLRIMGTGKQRPLSAADIPVFGNLPNDLPHVAGVISQVPQTPLSHVNLRAKQSQIPNAYIKAASDVEEIAALDGQLVFFETTPEGYTLRKASVAEIISLTPSKPKHRRKLPRDLTQLEVRPLNSLRHKDHKGYGSKAANLGQLRHIIGSRYTPDGYAVPFAFYDQFMKAHGFYDKIRNAVAMKDFHTDTKLRTKTLKKIRKDIKAADLPQDMFDKITALQARFPEDVTPRCRSSANSEDIAGFTGAGLYSSYTHKADEGHLGKSIKQVWASLWNFRAYEEREFFGFDHFEAAMGVLIHPNFKHEKANGVAITKNIYFSNLRGFYINSQVGEYLVTNPVGNVIAEELLLVESLDPDSLVKYDTIRVRDSNLTDTPVISSKTLNKLTRLMENIHYRFQSLYPSMLSKDFAMDIEFKVTQDDRLIIKQARPWR